MISRAHGSSSPRRSGCPARSPRTGCPPRPALGADDSSACASAATSSPLKRVRPATRLRCAGDLVADGVAEVAGRAQRALDARRRDVDRVAVEVAAEQLGDARAERVVDALRMVDVDAEARRRRQLDREHLDARQGSLDPAGDVPLELSLGVVDLLAISERSAPHKKWAPRAHFAKPVKCGVSRIAATNRRSACTPRGAQALEILVVAGGFPELSVELDGPAQAEQARAREASRATICGHSA